MYNYVNQDGSSLVKAQQNSSSSMKDLLRSQSNGSITMKENNNETNGTSHHLTNETQNLVNGDHNSPKRKSKKQWRKRREETADLSDSTQSSSSDDSDVVQSSVMRGTLSKGFVPKITNSGALPGYGKNDQVDSAMASSSKIKNDESQRLLSDVLRSNEVGSCVCVLIVFLSSVLLPCDDNNYISSVD